MAGPDRRSRGRSTRSSKPYASSSRIPQRRHSPELSHSGGWLTSIGHFLFGTSPKPASPPSSPESSHEVVDEGDSDEIEIAQSPLSQIASSSSRQVLPESPDQAVANTNHLHEIPSNVAKNLLNPDAFSQSASSQPSSTRVEQVRAFFVQKGQEPLNEIEREGLLTILAQAEQGAPARPAAPFRFSSATPSSSRDVSPSSSSGSKKVLSRNPNGLLKYSGAGSSRVKNRYVSPSFGAASPARGATMRVTPNKDERLGSKRRRTSGFTPSNASHAYAAPTPSKNSGFTFATPPPSARAQAPDPSPNRVRDAKSRGAPGDGGSQSSSSRPESSSPSKQSHPVGQTSHSILRRSSSPTRLPQPPLFAISTTGVPQTQPKQPSPLRQMFVPHSSPSTGSDQPEDSPKRQSETAKYMASLISAYDEPKKTVKEDIRNPYQDAVPGVKRKRTKVVAAPKKRKAVGKGKAKEDGPETPAASDDAGLQSSGLRGSSKISTQKLVEASVPKGSKRAKPPTSGATSAKNELPPTRRSPRLPQASAPKMLSFDLLTAGSGSKKPVEVNDVESADTNEDGSPSKKAKLDAPAPKSYGIGLGKASPMEVTSTPSPSIPPASTTDRDPPPSSSSLDHSSKPKLPASLFAFASPQKSQRPDSEITPPTLDTASAFTASSVPQSSQDESQIKPVSAFSVTSELSKPSPLAPRFPSTLAHTQPKEPSKLRQSFAASSDEEQPSSLVSSDGDSPLTDEDIQKQVLGMPKGTLPSFNFLPMKAIDVRAEDQEIVAQVREMKPGECPKFDFESGKALINGVSKASEKPSSASSTGGFNWSAAGLKPPASSSSQWKCSCCDLMNKDEGITKDKCGICESPRVMVNGTSSSATPSKPIAPPASTGGFNWAAAGLAPPAKKADEWICATCSCKNTGNGKKCSVCETDRS